MYKIGETEFEALSKMPFDFEIMGRIYYQAKELLPSFGFNIFNPNAEERDIFINILLDIMIKISAMKYHLSNYETYEQQCIEQLKLKAQSSANSHTFLQADELLFELEAFMFQMKSALDLAVKLIGAVFPGRFKTYTFGDKGGHLIKGLEKFKEDGKAKNEIVNSIISMIKEDQNSWLKQAITHRDTLAHFKTTAGYNYKAQKDGEEFDIIIPKIAGLNVLLYMQTTYSNCLEFIQDFMSLVIGMLMPKGFTVGVRNTNISSVGEPLNQYIKFAICIDTRSVDGSDNTWHQ